MDDQILESAEGRTGAAARRARRQGDQHAGLLCRLSARRDAAPRSAVLASRPVTVVPPSWHFDLKIGDLIEEVARASSATGAAGRATASRR